MKTFSILLLTTQWRTLAVDAFEAESLEAAQAVYPIDQIVEVPEGAKAGWEWWPHDGGAVAPKPAPKARKAETAP